MSHPTASDRTRRGTTLVELLAALVLLGLLFLGMRTLLAQLGDGNDRVSRATVDGNARGNGAHLLRTLLRRATVGADSTHQFAGDDTNASFDAGCDVPSGWVEDCRVALEIVPRLDSSAVVAQLPGVAPETLLVSDAQTAFRYLSPAASDYAWMGGWGSRISMPAALALVTPYDTLLFQVGGR
jgi:hypothetical protein